MRKVQFANDYFYHVYNRGTDKREIFSDEKDYFRFIHDLFEFNDNNAVVNANFRFVQQINYGGSTSMVSRAREQLVDIISFCLMPNHFHFILKQLKDGGIVKFMQKIGTGYTMYFNQKHKRSGVLFQGKFKAILIDRDEYFLHLSGYIHSNPVEIIEPGWKDAGIKDWPMVNDFLQKYRWSSYQDYIGIKNFPSVINKDFLLNYFQDTKRYQQYLKTYLVGDLERIKEVVLE